MFISNNSDPGIPDGIDHERAVTGDEGKRAGKGGPVF